MLNFDEFTNEKNELQEAPVKPKEKEKEKEKTKNPDKNPSINPWKREPDVKPGEEPAPKALLENENSSKINSKEGMAFVSWKNVHNGYDIVFTIEGGIRDNDKPKGWEKQLEEALNEAEKMIMKKLPWLQ